MSDRLRTLGEDGGDRGVKMSTIGIVRDLAEVFLWVGIAGAGLAVLCAIVAAVALAAGSAGWAGGASAVWIGGAMLSLTSGFSGQWLPAIIAGGALMAGLILGAVARSIIRGVERRPKPEPAEDVATGSATASASAAPAASPVPPRRIVGVHTVTSESIR